jgi:sterol desaturase/sphingolipid hydroxylase (fatty acid hydroxylase superfamily)
MELSLLYGCGLFLAIAACLFGPLEVWRPAGAPGPSAKTAAVCAGLFIFNTLLMQAVGAPLLELIRAFGLHATRPGPARIAVAVLLADVCGYWVHRAMHRVPTLWKLHRMHHDSEHLNWLEAWRQHPLDFLAHGIAVGLPAALLGASLAELASVVLLRKLLTSFLHANVSLELPRLGLLIATPAFHRVHHSKHPRDHDRNFAGTFPVVDRIFGTYSAPRAEAR